MLAIQSRDRLTVIDSLRGFALFGVLLINMFSFHQPPHGDPATLPVSGVVDQTLQWLIRMLIMGKAYSIFAFLFGAGIMLQWDRLQLRGIHPLPLMRRRLGGLLIMGLIHSTLIWSGDILKFYALFGLVLLAFAKRQDKTIKRWALSLLVVFLAITFSVVAMKVLQGPTPAEVEAPPPSHHAQVFETGGYGDVVSENTSLLLSSESIQLFLFGGLYLLPCFLTGMLWIRKDLFSNSPAALKTLQSIWRISFPLSLVMLVAYGILGRLSSPGDYNWIRGAMKALEFALQPVLSLAYVSGFQRLFAHGGLKRWFKPLAPLGRMALSNYLIQSLFFTALFYGYGVGLLNQLTMTQLVLITISFYGTQLVLSRYWLKAFRFGPFEWAWRSFTYKTRMPWRKNAVVS